MNELLEIYLEASGGKYGDQNGIFAVRDHILKERDKRYDELVALIWHKIGNGEDGATPIEKLISDFSDEHYKLFNTLVDLTEKLDRAERASVPVKVRFEVTEKDMRAVWHESGGIDDLMRKIKDYLAAHAVIDAPASVPSVAPTADQVEALARVLHVAWNGDKYEWDDLGNDIQEHHRIIARAAIAHLSKRPEGLPTAEEIKYLPGKPHVFNNELLIAAYKALKTRHALEWGDETNKDGWQRVLDVVRNATYETLRPWLRDPGGCELDVTAIEIANIIHTASVGAISETWKCTAAQRVLDLCRKRIRECKECAGLKQRLHHAAVAWNTVRSHEAIDALDAALEGE